MKISRRTALAAAGIIASATMAFGAIATLSQPQAHVVADSTWAVAPDDSTWVISPEDSTWDEATDPEASVAPIEVVPMSDSTW